MLCRQFNISDTINFNLGSPPPTAPDYDNILGTDDLGRDVLARLIYGVRLSLAFGVLLTILGSVVGITLGALQGYYGVGLIWCFKDLLKFGQICQFYLF